MAETAKSDRSHSIFIAAIVCWLLCLPTEIYPVSKSEGLGLVLGGIAFGIAFQAAPYAVGWLFGQLLASPLLRRLIIAGMGAALAFWFWAWYATFINIAEPDAQDALTMVVVPAYAAIGMTILGGVLAVIDHFLRSSE
jgi:hypothetical protein